MKQILWLGLMVLVAVDAAGQRRGGSGGAGRGGQGSIVRGTPRVNRLPSRNAGRPYQRFGSGVTGGFYPDSGYPYDLDYPSPPSAIVEQPAVTIRQAAPPVANAVITTYTVAAPEASTAAREPQTFVIALQGGARIEATAVWVQDRVMHYIDTDDRSWQLPLTAVEREVTRKLNLERNLNLRLPPAK